MESIDNLLIDFLGNQHEISEKHLAKRISAFFSENQMPSYLKHKSIIVFLNSAKSFKRIGHNVTLSPTSITGGEVIDIFRKTHYNIIMGFDEFLMRVAPLEVFFNKRTDLIIPFNSDKTKNHSRYSSAFNSSVFVMDLFSDNPCYRISRKDGYMLKNKNKTKFVDGYENLVCADNENSDMYIALKIPKEKARIHGIPFYSLDKMLAFDNNRGLKTAFFKDELERYTVKNIRYLIDVDLSIKNDIIRIEAKYYKENSREIEKQLLALIENLIITEGLKNHSVENNLVKVI